MLLTPYGNCIANLSGFVKCVIAKDFDAYIVKDIEYDLEWRVPRTDVSEIEGDEVDNIRKLSELQRVENGQIEFRYPSLAEFVALVRALHAADKMEIFSKNVLYYLGDKFGDREHIVVCLRSDIAPTNFIRQIDVDRPIEGTLVNISTYLASVYVDAAAFERVKAVGILVKVDAQLSLGV